MLTETNIKHKSPVSLCHLSIVTEMQSSQQLKSKPELAHRSADNVIPDVCVRIYKGHRHTSTRPHKHTLA